MTNEELIAALAASILVTAPHSGETAKVRAQNAVRLFRAILSETSTPEPAKPSEESNAQIEALQTELTYTRKELEAVKTLLAEAQAKPAEEPKPTPVAPKEAPAGPRPPKSR